MTFPAIFDLSILNGSNGFRINGVAAGDASGISVASAGDVNGDGFADIIIGAYSANTAGGTNAGASYVVFGKATGFADSLELGSLDGSNGFQLEGIDQADNSGISVSSAGDFNGDGFDDLLIGANRADPGGDSDAGESYVVFGKAEGFAATISLASLDGTSGFRIDGIDAGDNSGRSVSSAGDINGDGFDDLIIGAYGGDPGGDSYAGESYLVFGTASGIGASLDLSTLNGANGFRIDGIDPDDFSGISVSEAGDVNGDGFDDILVGAIFAAPFGRSYAGESYVIFGQATGFTSTFFLGSLNGINGFRIDGVGSEDQSGRSVSSAGDLNGDGFDDIIVGAPYGDPGGDSGAGEAYVIFGRFGGFDPFLDPSALDGSNGFRLDGIDSQDATGFSVSTAGDVNGDGFDDLIIGAPAADRGYISNAGESYVVFGKASGFAANINLANLDGNNGFRLISTIPNSGSGVSVASAGDVNLDGFDDLIIGATGASPDGRGNAGESYVIFGRMPEFGVTRIGTNISQSISGGLGDDIVEGRGGDDVLRGQSGDDEIHGDEGNDTIDGGDGDDTISGGSGNDVITGGEGFNVISGGSGDDTVTTGAGDDEIDTGSGNDTVVGGAGNDVALLRIGNDSANGGNGNDTLDGHIGNDSLNGSIGDDVLVGGDGLDSLMGGSGNDMLNGDAGNDILNGQGGIDTMRGGSGDDMYVIDSAADIVIELPGEGIDTVRAFADFVLPENVDNMLMLSAARTGTGNSMDNTIFGTDAGDTISGLDGDDILRGNGARDTIGGGEGNDLLDGGAGRDTLTGGAGRDLFQYRDGDTVGSRVNCDTIADFDQAADERIQLALVDADSNAAGNQDFEWIGTAAFGNVAGQLRYQQVSGNTFIEGDLNGDGVSDYTIQLTGLYTLDASDFTGVADLFP